MKFVERSCGTKCHHSGKYGQDINGGTIYCTHSPCIVCAKMIVNAGIKRFVTYMDYPDVGGVRELLKEAGVELAKVARPKKEITFLD